MFYIVTIEDGHGQRVAFEEQSKAKRLARIWNDQYQSNYVVEESETAAEGELMAGQAVFALEDN